MILLPLIYAAFMLQGVAEQTRHLQDKEACMLRTSKASHNMQTWVLAKLVLIPVFMFAGHFTAKGEPEAAQHSACAAAQ